MIKDKNLQKSLLLCALSTIVLDTALGPSQSWGFDPVSGSRPKFCLVQQALNPHISCEGKEEGDGEQGRTQKEGWIWSKHMQVWNSRTKNKNKNLGQLTQVISVTQH